MPLVALCLVVSEINLSNSAQAGDLIIIPTIMKIHYFTGSSSLYVYMYRRALFYTKTSSLNHGPFHSGAHSAFTAITRPFP